MPEVIGEWANRCENRSEETISPTTADAVLDVEEKDGNVAERASGKR